MNKTNFGKNKISALIAMLALLLVALGCGAEKPSAPPTEAEAQTLVKNTLLEFADAVDKGDFETFRTNTSKELQEQSTNDQMKTAFKAFIDNKAAVLPILRDAAKKNVEFSPAFAVSDDKGYSSLKTTGTIESEPQPVTVNNEYIYQDGKWKLLKVELNLQ